MSMNRNLRSLVEGSSSSNKSHHPEEVKKGRTYMVNGMVTRGKGGMSNSQLATFLGWELTTDGPIMKWQNKDGEKWQAFMYEGGMRAGDFDDNSRFTIGYED